MVQQQRYPRFNPAQLLDSAYTTIGLEKAEAMGLVKNGYLSFNYQHTKALEMVAGNIVVTDLQTHTNFSESEDGTRNYGSITGLAGINLNGQPTLQSTIPVIIIPDRKRNTMQRAAVREGFANLCKANKRTMERIEVNPASVHLFQKTSAKNGSTEALVVIEAAGVFGLDSKGKAFYWSIMQSPLENFVQRETVVEEEAPRSKRPRRTNRSRTAQTGPSEEQGQNAEAGKELAAVS